jgi:hypothetical protein
MPLRSAGPVVRHAVIARYVLAARHIAGCLGQGVARRATAAIAPFTAGFPFSRFAIFASSSAAPLPSLSPFLLFFFLFFSLLFCHIVMLS